MLASRVRKLGCREGGGHSSGRGGQEGEGQGYSGAGSVCTVCTAARCAQAGQEVQLFGFNVKTWSGAGEGGALCEKQRGLKQGGAHAAKVEPSKWNPKIPA